ncbi:PDR/VanB family oxidoreductase [Caballeronia sp. 15711]|uniref:PDR/VanB family oxidoreductase n=1 Tax=Caballeronia sp. 15711 TaxID=3391029 RepID=UPI0039E34603
METMQLRVESLRDAALGVKSVVLVSATGEALRPFTAGSHIELGLPGGGTSRLTRHYSLLNEFGDGRYVIGVGLHPASRGGSQYIHGSLRVGELLESSAPRNHFPLNESAVMSTFIAGGIGVTPMLAMARRLSRLGRRWRMYYCVRTPQNAAFLDDLLSLTGGDVIPVYDGCAGIRSLDIDAVTAQAKPEDHFYCCGPAPLIAAFERANRERDPSTVHIERFESQVAPKAAASDIGQRGFRVRLAKSGVSLQIAPDRSILSEVLEAGIDVPNSCQSGICGSCETRVLTGRPSHCDQVLTASERKKGDRMMICVSRSLDEELTLDL